MQTIEPVMPSSGVTQISQCISREESKQRFGVLLSNLLIWVVFLIFCVVTMGTVAVLSLFGWLVRLIMSEYHVRKLKALGATASPTQFPQIAEAAAQVCRQFGIEKVPQVIVIASGETNAFAVKFAQIKVIVLLSELLEGVIDSPAELRVLLGHEIAHTVLDHGTRGIFEMYKPARYKAARELTCDNVGMVAAGDFTAAVNVIKKLCVGPRLGSRVCERSLIEESDAIYSGLVGWLLRRHLTYPPAGARIRNLTEFNREV